MAGTQGFKKRRKGNHGHANHHHASGNGLARYYLGLYQRELRQKITRKFDMFGTVREAFERAKRSFLGVSDHVDRYLTA